MERLPTVEEGLADGKLSVSLTVKLPAAVAPPVEVAVRF